MSKSSEFGRESGHKFGHDYYLYLGLISYCSSEVFNIVLYSFLFQESSQSSHKRSRSMVSPSAHAPGPSKIRERHEGASDVQPSDSRPSPSDHKKSDYIEKQRNDHADSVFTSQEGPTLVTQPQLPGSDESSLRRSLFTDVLNTPFHPSGKHSDSTASLLSHLHRDIDLDSARPSTSASCTTSVPCAENCSLNSSDADRYSESHQCSASPPASPRPTGLRIDGTEVSGPAYPVLIPFQHLHLETLDDTRHRVCTDSFRDLHASKLSIISAAVYFYFMYLLSHLVLLIIYFPP